MCTAAGNENLVDSHLRQYEVADPERDAFRGKCSRGGDQVFGTQFGVQQFGDELGAKLFAARSLWRLRTIIFIAKELGQQLRISSLGSAWPRDANPPSRSKVCPPKVIRATNWSITILPGPVSNAIKRSVLVFGGIALRFAIPPMLTAIRPRPRCR